MAYTYRYHLKRSTIRNQTNLRQHAEQIQAIIINHYGINLKDFIVEENYFEFKLYSTVSRNSLRKMGNKLSEIGFSCGFIRKEQSFYAILYLDETNDIHIELIDSMLIDEPTGYLEKVKRYYEVNFGVQNIKQKDMENQKIDLLKSGYIDILNMCISKSDILNIPNILSILSLKEKKDLYEDRTICCLVTGYHRRYSKGNEPKKYNEKVFRVEKCFDVEYVKNKIEIEESEGLDCFEFKKIIREDDTLPMIKKQIQVSLPEVTRIDVLNELSDKHYKFRIHNVGQAQATSLAEGKNTPFVYFDYGAPCGKNSNTLVGDGFLGIQDGGTIILSHQDQDHWWGVKNNLIAYSCIWKVPKQDRKVKLTKTLSEIILNGGAVEEVGENIDIGIGKITYSGQSVIRPSRPASLTKPHETGLTLRLEVQGVKGERLNILVTGDQYYDYITPGQLGSLDILVATHHGGLYCWSVRECAPSPGTPESLIVYSYGEGNSNGHPSKKEDYEELGWLNEHHTCSDGTLEIDILLSAILK